MAGKLVELIGGPHHGEVRTAYGTVLKITDTPDGTETWYAVVGDIAIVCDKPGWIPPDDAFIDPEAS